MPVVEPGDQGGIAMAGLCPCAHPAPLMSSGTASPAALSAHRPETTHAPARCYQKPSALQTSLPSQGGKCPPSIRNYSYLVILLLLQSCLSQDSWDRNLPPKALLQPFLLGDALPSFANCNSNEWKRHLLTAS